MSKSETNPSAPWHMWVIGILLLINSGMGTVGYLLNALQYEPYLSQIPEETLDYYMNAPLWMDLMWSLSIFGGLVSAILLLMRRRLSIPVMALAWMASAIAVIYSVTNPPPSGGNILFSTVIILIALLALFYMYWLMKRGVLR